jgi:hypothetical protein
LQYAAEWLDTIIDPDGLNVQRLDRGTLRGYLPHLVAFCLGHRPPQARVLDHDRVTELWWAQRPGCVDYEDPGMLLYAQFVTVRERAFRKWARRNVSRFGKTRYTLRLEQQSEDWMVALDERTSGYLPPDPAADWDMLDRDTIELIDALDRRETHEFDLREFRRLDELDARHDPYDLL